MADHILSTSQAQSPLHLYRPRLPSLQMLKSLEPLTVRHVRHEAIPTGGIPIFRGIVEMIYFTSVLIMTLLYHSVGVDSIGTYLPR